MQISHAPGNEILSAAAASRRPSAPAHTSVAAFFAPQRHSAAVLQRWPTNNDQMLARSGAVRPRSRGTVLYSFAHSTMESYSRAAEVMSKTVLFGSVVFNIFCVATTTRVLKSRASGVFCWYGATYSHPCRAFFVLTSCTSHKVDISVTPYGSTHLVRGA